MEAMPGKLFTVGSMVLTWYLVNKMPDRIHDQVESFVKELRFIKELLPRIGAYFNPYVTLTISENCGGDGQFRCRRNELFDNIASYLTAKCAAESRRLKAELGKDGTSSDITLDDVVQVTDDHNGARIWWYASIKGPTNRGVQVSFYPADKDPRIFHAVFHKNHRRQVLDSYLPEAFNEGRKLNAENTTQKLFTVHRPWNTTSEWTHVPFKHPATFAKLAMDPAKKADLIADLHAFREGEEFHSGVGKAWKRGYLLYGPPGTGKSTLISAMANELKYDVYDLDLTAVKNNTELRKLFLDTKGKSIIVMEDIDAIQVDLNGNRMVDTKKTCSKSSDVPNPMDPYKDDGSKVTLSGLLSFMDGLWSACGGERIIVFTTNHLEMLDPALTRRGRMDMHIEMSYCRFEAFKVLAQNYLKLDRHHRFAEIQRLLDENDISPADVAHNLMPNSNKRERDAEEVDSCLAELVLTLKKAKTESSSPKNAKKPSPTIRRSPRGRRNQA